MSTPSADNELTMTRDARALWSTLTSEQQQRMLTSTYCSECADHVEMVECTGSMEEDVFVLEGKCKICGHELRHVLEPQ